VDHLQLIKFWPSRTPEPWSAAGRNIAPLYYSQRAVFASSPSAFFIEARDDGSGGDNWRYKSCKAPVKSSPPTNQHPVFYRPDALPVAQLTLSKHWKQMQTHMKKSRTEKSNLAICGRGKDAEITELKTTRISSGGAYKKNYTFQYSLTLAPLSSICK